MPVIPKHASHVTTRDLVLRSFNGTNTVDHPISTGTRVTVQSENNDGTFNISIPYAIYSPMAAVRGSSLTPIPDTDRPHRQYEEVRRFLSYMEAQGWKISDVDDDEVTSISQDIASLTRCQIAADIVTAVDEARVYFENEEGLHAWVYIVLGNKPAELASDFSVKHGSFEHAVDSYFTAFER